MPYTVGVKRVWSSWTRFNELLPLDHLLPADQSSALQPDAVNEEKVFIDYRDEPLAQGALPEPEAARLVCMCMDTQ